MPSAATFSAGLSSNYTITYANGTLTVNPAALTITANNASKTYGQTATFAGTAFTTSGLVNGDTVDQRDPDQRRRGGGRGRRRLTVRHHRQQRRRLRAGQLHDQLCPRPAHGQPGRR